MIQDAGWDGGPASDGKTYSQGLRDRVVSSVVSGRTRRATAALFGVSVANVVKWSQSWLASGSAATKQMGEWRQLRLQRERKWLLAADRREAGPDVAGGGGRVGRARHAAELRGGAALLQVG